MADLYEFPLTYDERFTEAANEAYKKHYEKMFAGKGIHSILDCSFGTGCLTFCLTELGYEVSGSDLSASMLQRGAEKAAEKGLAVKLVQCDFRELSQHFTDTYDCVMSTGSAFAHVYLEDIKKTLKEMDCLVKEGGYLYFDSRNWEQELQDRRRFKWGNPFEREDGVRIHYVQDWEYEDDGSITIHISNGYEKNGRIIESADFEEHLHPFALAPLQAVLEELGYTEIMVKPFPWFSDVPFEEMDWYCVLAKKKRKK